MQPEVSYDGDRILFAYCEVSSMIPQDDPARLDPSTTFTKSGPTVWDSGN